MKNFGLIALAASAKLAFAHTTIYAAWINGEDQGLGNSADGYIRSPPNNDPLKDVTSKDITCNVNNVATAKTLSVASGDKFTFEWHHSNRDASDDIIDASHKGPVMVYIAPTEAGTAGNGWVKIYEDGYDPSTKKWAVDTLIANKGQHSITIPDIAAGEYLLRAEIIALHEGDRIGGAQLYMECVQVKVTSDGTATLPEGVSIPGAYKATDAGINFNLYSGFESYPMPGPAVWDGASGSKAAAPVSSKAAATTSSVVANTQVVETSASSTTAAASSAAAEPATSAAAVSSVEEVSSAAASSVEQATSAAATSAVATSAAATSAAQKTTFATIVKTKSAAASVAAPTSTGTSTGTAAAYQRCGGIGHNGPTACEKGTTCTEMNPYYSQCVYSS